MVMKNPLRFGVVALIAISFSTSHSWAARSSGARLTIADHKVSVAGQPVASGTAIAPGDTIVTGSRSRAELTLPDGTVVRIGQGSSFTYTGSKLVLNQGTALVHATHKGTTVVSGSRTYTGGPAVVSAEVSKKTDGLYILQGGGKVNGVTLIPGQSSVLDRGKDRTFTFDLQKMEASSALVTKFPQTPWVAQTQALGAVQHQLLTAKVTPAGKARPTGSHDNVSGSLASIVSTGAAGTSVASRTGSANSPGGGALQLLGGPLSLGADKVAVIKSAVISTVTNGGTAIQGGTLQISGAISISSAVSGSDLLTRSSGVAINTLASSGGTLSVNGGALNAGGSGNTSGVVNTFTLNSNISAGGVTTALGGITKVGAGTLVPSGNNTYTGAITVNAGTLAVSNGSALGAGALNVGGAGVLTLTNPNLTIANIGTISSGATINYPTGGNIVFGGATLPQQAGQTVTINGLNYTAVQDAGSGGRLILQPAAH
jgi:autotransporter-associated beta strand protein